MRYVLVVVALMIAVIAGWLMFSSEPLPAPDRSSIAPLAPTAAEESGAADALTEHRDVRAVPAPKAPRTPRRAVAGSAPPSTRGRADSEPLREAPLATSEPVPPDRAQRSLPSAASATPGVAFESDASGGEAATVPPLVVPPVLLTAPAAYPAGGYQVIVERSAITPEARTVVAEGRVVLRVLVLTDGSVGEVRISASSANPVLDEAAVRAAMIWRFQPAMRDETPIEAWAVIAVQFVAP